MEKDIKARGVEIVFNDYVDSWDAVPILTRSGKRLEGDVVVSSRFVFLSYHHFSFRLLRSPLWVTGQRLSSSLRSGRAS